MSSKLSLVTRVSSILIMAVLLSSSVVGGPLVGTAAAASPSNPQTVYQATSPLATGTAPGSNANASLITGANMSSASLDWTEDTGPLPYGTEGWNYTPQTQITADTVDSLSVSYIFPIPSIWSSTPAWGPCNYVNGTAACRFPGLIYSTGLEGTQAPIITTGGVGYIVTNGLSVYAIDLASGKLLSSDFPNMDWS